MKHIVIILISFSLLIGFFSGVVYMKHRLEQNLRAEMWNRKFQSPKVIVNFWNEYVITFGKVVNDTIFDYDFRKVELTKIRYIKGDTIKHIDGIYKIDTLWITK